MVFSFNHSPIISSFAVDNKGRYGANAEKKCSNILLGAHVMMVMTGDVLRVQLRAEPLPG
jgi:serine transporter